MDSNLYINYQGIDEALNNLYNIEKELESFIEKQKKITEQMQEVWKGTNGEKAYYKIKEHNKKYDTYLIDLKNRITFLEKVYEASLKLEANINNKMEEDRKLEA